MFTKFALPLLLTALSTTVCNTPQSRPLRQLPKLNWALPSETAATPPRQAAASQARAEPNTHVFFKIGTRALDDDEFWSAVDRPIAFGIEADYRMRDSVLGAEFGFGFAIDAKDRGLVDTIGTFLEAYGGLRLTGDMGPGNRIHPYIGAGALVIFADESHLTGGAIEVDDDDTSFGGYAHIGAYYSINRHIHVGVDGRIVFGTDLDLFGISTNADYEQLSFIIGTGF